MDHTSIAKGSAPDGFACQVIIAADGGVECLSTPADNEVFRILFVKGRIGDRRKGSEGSLIKRQDKILVNWTFCQIDDVGPLSGVGL